MEKRKAYAYYEERSGRELQVEMGKRLNFPSHLHGELELFLVQSGCVCVGIDGEFRELKAGELAVVFPNTVHSYQCREADSRYMMAVCGTSLMGDYFPSLTQCRPRRPYLCGKALDPDVLYALHSLYRCRCTGADSSISRALLHLILAHVLPELSLEPAPEPKAMDLTSSVVRYIMRNFRQPLSLEHIAKELGVSKYHLSHVFSARLHTSFREYVNALRLDCARDSAFLNDYYEKRGFRRVGECCEEPYYQGVLRQLRLDGASVGNS